MIRSSDIHSRIGSAWPAVLAQLGIGEEFLRRKAGPCPACQGRDRYVFDNRKGRGDFFCRQCGPGDGFELLSRVHGWSFAEARARVLKVAGITPDDAQTLPQRSQPATRTVERAEPTGRVLRLRRESCRVSDCQEAVRYLQSRCLWPLPPGCTLRAHPGAPYWHEARQVGRYPALLADVRDRDGQLVTVHVTYLHRGRKLTEHEPRKLLSPLTGREGCAVRLTPLQGEAIGVAEGIETALSASHIDGIPVWAALNTTLLAKFMVPEDCPTLWIYADRDEPGLTAARKLYARMRGIVDIVPRVPEAPAKDFNEMATRKRDQHHKTQQSGVRY